MKELQLEPSLVLDEEERVRGNPRVRLIRFMDALNLFHCNVTQGYINPAISNKEDKKWLDPEM